MCQSAKKANYPSNASTTPTRKNTSHDTIQIHEDAINKGQNVLLIDDLLATGGTIKANVDLIEKLGGKVVGLGFLIELEYLDGRKIIGDKHEVVSLIKIKTPKQ